MTPPDRPQGPLKDDDRREALALHERVWDLERRVEKQSALIEALFALLEAQGTSRFSLMRELQRIEQEKQAVATKPCSRCGRAMGRRQMSCVYCGEPRVVESPFELI